MKKKVLMSIVLLALIGTSAVFAQEPTLDKLSFNNTGNATGYTVRAKNKDISGAVVIPDTYNGKPVTQVAGFSNCKGITSVTIPNSVTQINASAFASSGLTSITIPASVEAMPGVDSFHSCTNLTSVTFQGSNIKMTSGTFQGTGDLEAKYKAGGAGTYTRTAGSNTWTKVGGPLTITGTGTRSDGAQVTISGDGTTITITGTAPGGGKFTDTYRKQ